MFWISHRGNITGRNPERENHPKYIEEALAQGYEVEIDVRYDPEKDEWWLGHDKPQYKIDVWFLVNSKLWCHAKTLDTLIKLMNYKDKINFFSHESDSAVFTSWGYILVQPGKPYNQDTIYMMPELSGGEIIDLHNVRGVCSDFVNTYKQNYDESFSINA